MKVIKSGDKDFELEKEKMFDTPVKTERGLDKEEQLRLVFNHLLSALFAEYDMIQYGGMSEEELMKKYVNIFMYEVKIRTKEERI